MKAILNNCTEGKVGMEATTSDKFSGYALELIMPAVIFIKFIFIYNLKLLFPIC